MFSSSKYNRKKIGASQNATIAIQYNYFNENYGYKWSRLLVVDVRSLRGQHTYWTIVENVLLHTTIFSLLSLKEVWLLGGWLWPTAAMLAFLWSAEKAKQLVPYSFSEGHKQQTVHETLPWISYPLKKGKERYLDMCTCSSGTINKTSSLCNLKRNMMQAFLYY